MTHQLSTLHKRLILGLLQGVLLYLFWDTESDHFWAIADGVFFSPLILVVTCVPVLVILALDSVRPRTLLMWAAGVATLLAGLAVYDIVRRANIDGMTYDMWGRNKLLPSGPLSVFTLVGLLIGQSLVMAGDADKRLIASYPSYFDVAWKLAIQINFVAIFVLLFWAVLWTGAGLFNLIKISFFSELLQKNAFSIPVTTLAAAYAIHVTDVRVNLVRGFRTLKLTTLSWLLPIMAFFVAAFMATLPFRGLDILWATHHTSQIMLGAIAWLVLLINAVYQDGTPEHRPGRLLRVSGILASALLLPLTMIGIYAVLVRVGHYGWTVHLIDVTACLLVSACYAVGYMLAIFDTRHWLKRIEKTNIYTSCVILAVLIALFTPIADPARISVSNQLSRLKNGEVTLENFDFNYLRTDGAIYGIEGLNKLKKQQADAPSTGDAKDRIEVALGNQPYKPMKATPPTAVDVAKNITVYPQGHILPDSFIHQDWSKPVEGVFLPLCLQSAIAKCEAFMIDAVGNAPDQIILINDMVYTTGIVLSATKDGWDIVGSVATQINCKGVREAMRTGQYKMVPSLDHDIEVNGMHVPINQTAACPQEP